MMRVTYLGHSGFLLEMEDALLLFDYYQGSLPEMDPEKTLFVFVSHVHYDHYNPDILKLRRQRQNIWYLFSDDVPMPDEQKQVIRLSPEEERRVNGIRVRTLPSTDEGVAFWIEYQGIVIYHAGDLNWWHWEEESTLYNETMKERYQSEIGKLKEALSGKTIDVAFLVLDPRQEDAYALGMEHFLLEIPVQFAVPMHLWEEYALARQYVETYGQTHEKTRFWCVSGKGEEVILPEEA